MSRAQTILLTLIVVQLLVGALCLAAARSTRGNRALRMWGFGALAYALGLAISMQRWAPPLVALTLGNALIAWSAILLVEGAIATARLQLQAHLSYGALAVVFGILAVANQSGNLDAALQAQINLAVPALFSVAMFGFGAYWLLRAAMNGVRHAMLFLSCAMLLGAVVWTFRVALLLDVSRLTHDPEGVDMVVSLFAVAHLVIALACTLAIFWIELHQLEGVLVEATLTDAPTGVPNRRAIMQRFQEAESQAVRHGGHFALLILDIDYFRQFNDRYGHAVGDAVLRHVAACLSGTRRAGDTLARVGGGEFVMLLSGDQKIAQAAAERLCARVQEETLVCGDVPLSVTVSGGLAMFPADGVQWDDLFAEADWRLNVSKHNGRNRVTASRESAQEQRVAVLKPQANRLG